MLEGGVQGASDTAAQATSVGPSRFGGAADYSELLPGHRAPHPISKGAPLPPFSVERTFCHDPKFVSTDEGRNVDGPLNQELHLSSFLTYIAATAAVSLSFPLSTLHSSTRAQDT